MSSPPPFPEDRFGNPGSREQPVRSPFGNDQPAPFGRPSVFGQPASFVPPGPSHPPPGYQPYGGAPLYAPTRTNGFAVTSLVLGICGIVLFCLYAIPCILAIIFGAISLNQFKTQPNVYSGRGMAVAGLVLGIVGVGLLVLLVAGTGFSAFD
jgi:hypothetical protein